MTFHKSEYEKKPFFLSLSLSSLFFLLPPPFLIEECKELFCSKDVSVRKGGGGAGRVFLPRLAVAAAAAAAVAVVAAAAAAMMQIILATSTERERGE